MTTPSNELADLIDANRLAERALAEVPGLAIVVFDDALRVCVAGGDVLAPGADGPDGLVGRPVRDVLPAEIALAAMARCRRTLAGRESTCAVRSSDGQTAFVVDAKPLRSDGGNVIAGLIVVRDVSSAPDQLHDDGGDVVPAGRSDGRRYQPPGLSAETVARRSLMVRAETADAQVVLMTAPAGSGKTTVAAQIAAAAPCCAWISLDESHNDPAVITETMLAAIASHGQVVPLNAAGAGRTGPERLADALGGCPKGFVLVLDDAHHLHARAARDVVADAMRSVPRGARLVIASRTELDLPHGTLAENGSLLHLRGADLAMSAAECAALVAGAGLDLSAQDVEALARRTDGWPAGVSLLTTAMAERGGPACLGDVGGWEASVAAYLREAVLGSHSESVCRFLVESSVIETLSGPICDATMERNDSARIIRRLARGNVPMTAINQRGEQYRLNPLLREMLTQDLRADDPDAVTRLHLRASEWYEHHGDLEAAIHHACEAGAIDRAGTLVGHALPDYVFSRRGRIADLVRGFPPDEPRREHHLAVAKGWDAMCSGAMEAATYWVAVAEGQIAQRNGDADDGARGQLALLHAADAVAGVSEMAREAGDAYRLEPPGSPWRPLACYLEGVAAELMGDSQHAHARLREADHLAAIGAPVLRPQILAQLSQLAGDEDDPEASRQLAASAEAVMYEHGLEDSSAGAIVEALSALDLAKDGNEAKARDRLDRGAAKLAAPGWMPSWMAAQTQIVLAQAHLQLGDASTARGLERAARRTIQEGARDAPVLSRRLASLRATLDAFPAVSVPGSGHLTTAELRVLRYLPTHLSFRQIGERLYLSRHTVKTEAISAYRKLGVNSRSDAVRQARELGILE
jgi:LuxR family transcriptional regulator, maltose regulon positive regulatory protein